MSFLTKTLSNLFHIARTPAICSNVGFKTLTETGVISQNIHPEGLFNVSIRNIMRCHFPRPSERKRIKRHGWYKRMSTRGGQQIIMRRILKGKHVYTH